MSQPFNLNFDFDIPSLSKFPDLTTELKMIKTQNNLMLHSMNYFQGGKDHDSGDNILEVDSLAQKLSQNKQQQKQQQEQNQAEIKHPTPQKKKKLGCTCKKTHCLKMYCECFSSNKPCNVDCQCLNCKNTSENQENIINAKISIRDKGTVGLHSCSLSQKRCNCKKSNCQKKYCQCFNSGVKCSEACKCNNCYNKIQEKSEQKQQQEQEQNDQEIQNLPVEQILENQDEKNNFAQFYN